ncbi:MAG TPA: PP2C family serine/threonine-protein phosphatase [Anaerolineales bacterium]
MDITPPIIAELTGTWQVVGAAVQGVSHQKLDLPCQDVQGYRVLPGGLLLAALADGAGTAVHSAEGARCAVETALDTLAAALEEGSPPDLPGYMDLLRFAYAQARQAVTALAEETGQPERSYAATLICAIAGSDGLAVGQLGDGAVIARTPGGELLPVTRTQRGEYANETYFLCQEDALDLVEYHVLQQPVSGLAMMSDGLIRLALKLPSQEPHAPFFQPLFAFAVSAGPMQQAAGQLAAFLDSERVRQRTDDDKALVLAVRLPPPIGQGTAAVQGDG